MTICAVHWLGFVPYQTAWDLQARLAEEIAAGQRPPTLLLLEHPHTYTFGRAGKAENLLWNAEELERRGITTYWVDRGGDVTYHGPGQLVGYPLLPLGPVLAPSETGEARLPAADYVGYIRKLEQTLIEALAGFGLAAMPVEGLTGVWLPPAQAGALPAKIAAIGVKVDRFGVSRHGFALNVAPQMVYWQGIIGCGLAGYPITSLAAALGAAPAMADVRQAVETAFGKVFGFELRLEVLE